MRVSYDFIINEKQANKENVFVCLQYEGYEEVKNQNKEIDELENQAAISGKKVDRRLLNKMIGDRESIYHKLAKLKSLYGLIPKISN
ncbi:unnamed protein product [Didymodactylos carnosus]|uniref:Uncharacterized protein n=1 Tax=Didymodactylos carnosus TaxID=1234261 RepID=A0A816FJR5_9BILA|nr:unnamed protein product [Didymodactylos carnosus]CAF4612809.1 unnamed protein product [Didymodactylos carnosus]